MTEEAKQETIQLSPDEQADKAMDEALDKLEQETPSETEETQETSTEKETTEQDTESTEDSEETTSQKTEEESKEEETEVPKGFHKHPAWQRIIKARDEAKSQLEELRGKSALSEEDRTLLSEVKSITSSREYVEAKMKSQGYSQQAINDKLKESGFEVDSKPDIVSQVANKLNLDPKALDNPLKMDGLTLRDYLTDLTRVSQATAEIQGKKVIGEELQPIKSHVEAVERERGAAETMKFMEDTVKKEGVLDFGKDILPEIETFMDKNPDAKQSDIKNHFKDINHKLTIERFRLGKKQADRDEKKGKLKQPSTETVSGGLRVKRTGNPSDDIDAALDNWEQRTGQRIQ